MDEEMLPKFNYYIDESDPDIVVLRRQDGSFAAAFSARGGTIEGIVEATKEDYRKLIEAHAGSMELREALRAARDEFCRAKGEPKGGEIQDTIDTSFH
jgi:hypothetical protein